MFMMSCLTFLVLLLCFCGMAHADAKTFSIPDELLYPAGICGFFLVKSHPLFLQKIILSLGIGLVFWFYKKQRQTVGWGDIKLFVLCTLILPVEMVPCFFLFCGCFGALSHRIRQRKVCPFAPAIVASFTWIFLY